MFDLDSDSSIETTEDIVARYQTALNTGPETAPVRIAIGCWIAKGYLNTATAEQVLRAAGAYQVIPAAKRDCSLPLALWLTSYFHRNLPKTMGAMPGVDMFMYRAQQASIIFTFHYTREEQDAVVAMLTEYKKFHG